MYHYDAPRVLDVSPDNGPTVGGTNITIRGSSFGQPLGAHIVSKCNEHIRLAMATNIRIQGCDPIYHTLIVGIRVEIKGKECSIVSHHHNEIVCTVRVAS